MSSANIMRRSLRFRVLAVFVFAALVLYRLCFYPSSTPTWLPLPGQQPSDVDVYRANATLGFGAIYVVSGNNSPRRHGLLQAANVTELEFTIPSQPTWPEATLARHPKLGKGSLMAWLGHLHTLRQFIASGAETALVLEDDVDWDIHLRSLQAPLVATAVRALLSPDLHPVTDLFPTPEAAAQRYPYGSPAHWDLLYLGHCGDYFHGMDRGFEDGHVHPSDLAREEHISFNDSSLPAPDDLHPWTASLLRNLGVPPHTRLVHRSVFPLCTFAYAVTRSSARRMVEDLVSLEEEAHTAYDVAILISCRDKGLKCYTVNPELFHHVPGKSMIGGVDNNTHLPPVDAMAQKQVELRHETPNIGCGFWGGGFAFPDGDDRQLEYLRTEVGRKGNCLKKGR